METEAAVCLSCLKWFDAKPNANLSIYDGSQHAKLYRRFMDFAREHLKLAPGVLNVLESALVSSGSTSPVVFCVACENTLIVICNLYEGLCEVQLQLARKVGMLAELLDRAKEAQGRPGEEDWNRGLLSHLATQIGLNGREEDVNWIRNQLAIKCKLKAICHVRASEPVNVVGLPTRASSSEKTVPTSNLKTPPVTIAQEKIRPVDVIPIKKGQSGQGKHNNDAMENEKEPTSDIAATITEVKQGAIEEEEEGETNQGWPREDDDPLNTADSMDNLKYDSNCFSSIIIEPKEERNLFIDEDEYASGSCGGSQEGGLSLDDGSMVLPLDVSNEEVDGHNSLGNYADDSSIAHCSVIGNQGGSVPPTRKRQKRHPRLVLDPTAIPDDILAFVEFFKRRRVEMRLTQSEVAMSLGNMYGRDSELFSQTTVSRFEAMNLTKSNMEKLRPLFEKWLVEADPRTCSSVQHIPLPDARGLKRRKKRTSISPEILQALEDCFQRNQKPTTKEVDVLGDRFHIEKSVLRVWFCNRRQKERRANSSQSRQKVRETLTQEAHTYTHHQYQKQQNGRRGLHVVVNSLPPPPPLTKAPESARTNSNGSLQLHVEPVRMKIVQ